MQAPNRLQDPSGLLSELLRRARHDETAVASQSDRVLTRFFQNQVDLLDLSDPDNLSVDSTFSVPLTNTGASA